jgi:drug/metabolite transporter (DMT)-like permease
VLGSVFQSAIIFTVILFYFVYDEKLALRDIFGIALIIIGAIVLGISKETEMELSIDSDPSEQNESSDANNQYEGLS